MKLPVLMLFALFDLAVLAQNVFGPLQEPYCVNSELMRENHIRSVRIFAQFGENGVKVETAERIGIKSFELDEDGYVVYEFQYNPSIVSPIIWDMNEGIEFNLYKYNNHKQKIYTYFENERWKMESFFNYDKNLKLSGLETFINGEKFEKVKFKWRNGKMVKSKIKYLEDDCDRTYNQDGEIIEDISYGDTYAYQYQKSGDTNSYSVSWYRGDSLVSDQHFSYLGEHNSQMTHFLSLNGFGDRTEVSVSYDEQGNTTDYQFQEFEKSIENGEKDVDRHAMYTIKNEYDDRGFLVKQIFYLRNENTQLMVLEKVLHYEYETNPLEDKLAPGSIGEIQPTIQLR